MKRFLLLLVAVVLLVGGLSVPVFSDSTGTVTVTAEVAQISVSVSPGSVSYGLVPLNTTGLQPIDNPLIFALNNGNCWVDMLISGADTTDWALGSGAGPETYAHYYSLLGPAPDYIPLSDSNQDLGPWDSISPGTSQLFQLQMDTPTESTHFGTQSTSVTVMVTYAEEGLKATLEAGGPYDVGETSAVMTATVTDELGNPVEGLTAGMFSIIFLTPPATVPTPVITDVGGGVYNITYDLSSLAAETYVALVTVNDGSSYAATADTFDIVTP